MSRTEGTPGPRIVPTRRLTAAAAAAGLAMLALGGYLISVGGLPPHGFLRGMAFGAGATLCLGGLLAFAPPIWRRLLEGLLRRGAPKDPDLWLPSRDPRR